MAKHAILSASGAKRWMCCPPSARLEMDFPDTRSAYADEGTFAHKLAELKLCRQIANTVKPGAFKSRLAKLKADPLYSKALEDYVDQYVELVTEKYLAAGPNVLVFLEQRLDFSPWVPDGFGTGDVVLISENTIEIIDLKFGKGVPVFAEENPQTRLYGLGAVHLFDLLYDFETVNMTIIQPRLDSVSTESLTVDNLIGWAGLEVLPAAKLAHAGEGEFASGDHCRFCRAKAVCRARAEENLELAALDFLEPALLSNEEIGQILAKAEALRSWAGDVQSYALDQAESHGVVFEGWKLVEGRSNRVYVDQEAVALTLSTAGIEEVKIYKKALFGITDMEKNLGKKRFAELLEGLVEKPPGKPALVAETDKRPAISGTAAAEKDFATDFKEAI